VKKGEKVKAINEFNKYKEHILNNEFFEAHEVLEEVWQKLRKTDNNLQWAYKGLINAAVALELKKRKRETQVYKAVWKNFEKYNKYYKLSEEIKKTAEFIENFNPC
jgi:predicted metal-dependent hydrolase